MLIEIALSFFFLSTITALQKVSRKAMIQLSEMIHFTRQIQGYCQLEVLDYSWHDLKDFFKKREGDLDELIETHRIYLDSLIGKMLLRGSGKRGHLVSRSKREA